MSIRKQYFVYILASDRNGTLYIGMTNDLIRRVNQHKTKAGEGFTKKYNVDKLVYYQAGCDVEKVIAREKQLKKWNRAWKLRLIDQFNPEWKDLFPEIAGLQEEKIKETEGLDPEPSAGMTFLRKNNCGRDSYLLSVCVKSIGGKKGRSILIDKSHSDLRMRPA